MKPLRILFAILAGVAALAAPSLSLAQKKVPGEKWRQTVSIEASGMKMPARTLEICVPIGKQDEALARPPENADCKMNDAKRTGNKFTANMSCTGKMPMEGHVEMTTEGNRTIGKIQMQMQGMAMTMNSESTKLGTACEATDYSDYKPPAMSQAAPVMPPTVDICAQMGERVKDNPRELASNVAMFLDKNAQCGKHAAFKTYCSAVQTPAGFMSLEQQESSMVGTQDRTSPYVIPLTASVQACGLGTGKAGIDALRTRLLGVAEKEGAWGFLVREGNDATFAMLTATAKRECAGRSFTNAANARYAGLCRNYGVALVRGDKAAAQEAAGVTATSMPMSTPTSTPAQPAATVTTQEAAATPAQAEDDATKSKTRNALDKGKQKLRNIFGGGG